MGNDDLSDIGTYCMYLEVFIMDYLPASKDRGSPAIRQ